METLLDFGHTTLAFLIVFTLVVFIHEFGHYWVARRCGVRVEVFSIGFGREIFGYSARSGTRWKLSLIPLGGYVRFYGDEGPASNRATSHLERMTPEDRAVCFHYKSIGQRSAIVAAGPMANFVLALALYIGLFMTAGRPITPAVVDQILPDSAALEAGFLPGDHVVRIDDTTIDRFEELRDIVMFAPGVTMTMGVIRDSAEIELRVTPREFEFTDTFGNVHVIGRLGISVMAAELVRLGPIDAVGAAFFDIYVLVKRSLQGLGEILIGKRDSSELGGPIMIAQMSGETADAGLLPMIEFVVILSTTLGMINLFPIPLLDGGHLVFYLFEAVRGRPMGRRAQEFGYMIGFALVISLMVFATFNDLTRPSVVEFFTRIVG
jgi:regulator of sigma E protease